MGVSYTILTTTSQSSIVTSNLNTITSNGQLTTSLNSNPTFASTYPGINVVAISFITSSPTVSPTRISPGKIAAAVIFSIIGGFCIIILLLYFCIFQKKIDNRDFDFGNNKGVNMSNDNELYAVGTTGGADYIPGRVDVKEQSYGTY